MSTAYAEVFQHTKRYRILVFLPFVFVIPKSIDVVDETYALWISAGGKIEAMGMV